LPARQQRDADFALQRLPVKTAWPLFLRMIGREQLAFERRLALIKADGALDAGVIAPAGLEQLQRLAARIEEGAAAGSEQIAAAALQHLNQLAARLTAVQLIAEFVQTRDVFSVALQFSQVMIE